MCCDLNLIAFFCKVDFILTLAEFYYKLVTTKSFNAVTFTSIQQNTIRDLKE